MKNLTITILLLLGLTHSLTAQDAWLWVHTGGTSANNNKTFDEYPTAIVSDTNNNIYICGKLISGSTQRTVKFTGFGNRNLLGQDDLFIAKYDCSGQAVWLKTSISKQTEIAYDMTIDEAQNLYVVGRAQHTPNRPFIFESDTLKTSSLFISKYSTNGQLIWAYENDTLPLTYAKAVVVGNNQTLYVLLEDLAIPNTIAPAEIIPGVAAGSNRYKIMALDTAGSPLWIKDLSNITHDSPKMSIDAQNNLYFNGYYLDTINFKGVTHINDYPNDVSDCYLAKLDNQGNLVWFSSFTDSTSLSFNQLLHHSNGKTYTSWRYYYLHNDYKTWASTPLLGWGSDPTANFGSRSGIAEYQNPKNILNQHSGTNENNNLGLAAMAEKPNGDIVSAGTTIGDFTFIDGDTVIAQSQLISPAMVMADQNLVPYHQQELFGTDVASIMHVTTDARGNVYATGAFRDSLYFGSGLGIKSQGGKSDFFIAKWGVSDCNLNIGIHENHQKNKAVIYPNPASNYITVKSDVQPTLIKVFSVAGKFVFASSLNRESQFEIPNIPPGIYIIFGYREGKMVAQEKLLIH